MEDLEGGFIIKQTLPFLQGSFHQSATIPVVFTAEKPLRLQKVYNIILLISKDVFPGEKSWIKCVCVFAQSTDSFSDSMDL